MKIYFALFLFVFFIISYNYINSEEYNKSEYLKHSKKWDYCFVSSNDSIFQAVNLKEIGKARKFYYEYYIIEKQHNVNNYWLAPNDIVALKIFRGKTLQNNQEELEDGSDDCQKMTGYFVNEYYTKKIDSIEMNYRISWYFDMMEIITPYSKDIVKFINVDNYKLPIINVRTMRRDSIFYLTPSVLKKFGYNK